MPPQRHRFPKVDLRTPDVLVQVHENRELLDRQSPHRSPPGRLLPGRQESCRRPAKCFRIHTASMIQHTVVSRRLPGADSSGNQTALGNQHRPKHLRIDQRRRSCLGPGSVSPSCRFGRRHGDRRRCKSDDHHDD
ncbi:MAG: hypothetical protein CMJ69_15475 [Planctomycetaceae bacterium]|nr:hypothetical protein [Planctomycetaceae bacterium]